MLGCLAELCASLAELLSSPRLHVRLLAALQFPAVCDLACQAAVTETPEAWAAVLGGLAELCAALGEPLGGGRLRTSTLGAGGAPDVDLFAPGQLAALAAAAPTAVARRDVLRIAGALPALPAAAELGDW